MKDKCRKKYCNFPCEVYNEDGMFGERERVRKVEVEYD